MNKTERMIVMLLFAGLIGWTFLIKKPSTRPVNQQPAQNQPAVTEPGQSGTEPVASDTANVSDADSKPATESAPAEKPAEEEVPVAIPEKPEQIVVITNDLLRVAVSSWGGGVKLVELSEFRSELDKESAPIEFDFSSNPSLSVKGINGLGVSTDYDIETSIDRSTVQLTRKTAEGLLFKRTIAATNGYNITVIDELLNEGDAVYVVPDHSIVLGPMQPNKNISKVRGLSILGIDSFSSGPDGEISYLGSKIPQVLFGAQGGCSKPNVYGMDMKASKRLGMPLDWVAAKNKFFVEILEPKDGCEDATIYASRDSAASNSFSLASVSADLHFSEKALEPGESLARELEYYIGPKKYLGLKKLGKSKARVMDFGFFRYACIILLPLLNAIHFVLPNYGIAIILLTIIVKVIFWPVTHKGTESMKKMQMIQPEVKKLREKYKDKPKKLQTEQMLLYKKHGVNPLAGCLPMLIQIPVFIALFKVLRSAVELRFAPFLWIKDLSEPEGLFAGMIPIVGSLNILPLAMAGTMVLQQRLTPTAGDPQQQKMMMFMPIMMLFIFYGMPSALVLYWTISQGLSILQLVLQQRKNDDGKVV